ncbi:MAG: SRPBCC family protein [Candidatus Rokubacteria bacterium]|nr:SRPBCC family protein [Candidatus Rokubacteria bacterium]
MQTSPGGMGDMPARAGGQTSGRGDFASGVNVGDTERMVSAVAGGALLLFGLARGALGGYALAGVGAALAYRGLSGHSILYRRLGLDRSSHDVGRVQGNVGVRLERAVTVHTTPKHAYRAWRHLPNLARFMSHVERVEEIDRIRSRWTVHTPTGMKVTWDADITNDVPGRVIAWRTVDTHVVEHAGSVTFDAAPDGRSTIVRVSMQYAPPAGALGHTLVSAFGADPQKHIEQDLVAFKRAMEAGELAA